MTGRRAYCKRLGGLTTLALTAGCGAFDQPRSAQTVDPALRGTPESPETFDEQTTVSGRTWLLHITDRLVTLSSRDDGAHLESYEPTTLGSTGSFVVPASAGLAGGTAELLVAATNGEFNSRTQPNGPDSTTTAREHPDGTVRWEYPAFLDPLRPRELDAFRVNPMNGASETLVGLDLLTGDEQWRIDTDRELQTWDGSVVVFSDRVIGKRDGYSLETGDQLWQTTLPDPETAANPATGIHAGDAFVTADGTRVDVLDAETGTHRHHHPTSIDPYWSAHTDEQVLFGSQHRGPNTDSRLVALHVQHGHQWTVGESLTAIRPVAVGEVVYAIGKTTDGLFTLGIGRADGKVRWRTSGVVVAVDSETAYTVGPGQVAAVAADGTVRWERELSLDSLPDVSIDGGNLRGTYDPPNVVHTPSRLVVAGESAVTAFDTRNGERVFAIAGLDSVTNVVASVVRGVPRVFVATETRLGTARL